MKRKQIAVLLSLTVSCGAVFSGQTLLAEEAVESVEEEAEDQEDIQEEVLEDSASSYEVTETATKSSPEKKTEASNAADADGLIEDDGTVYSKSEGESLDDVIAKEEAQAAAGYIPPGFRVDPSQYPAANLTKNTQTLYWFLRDELSLNHAAACGVLANVQMEANFRPIALGDGGTSYGICQWHLGRFTRLMAYCTTKELDYNTLEGQMAYLKYELQVYYPHVLAMLEGTEDTAKGSYDAAYAFCYRFEMPDQIEARSQQRGNLAENEYYPKEFERDEENDGFAATVDTTDDPEEADGETGNKEYVTPTQVIAPEDFQVNLFEAEAAAEISGVEVPAAEASAEEASE